jgi:hypothetical protein
MKKLFLISFTSLFIVTGLVRADLWTDYLESEARNSPPAERQAILSDALEAKALCDEVGRLSHEAAVSRSREVMSETLIKTRALIDRYVEIVHRPEMARFLKPYGKIDDGSAMLNAWQECADIIGFVYHPVVARKTTPEEIRGPIPPPALARASAELQRAWNLLSPAKKEALRVEQDIWADDFAKLTEEGAALRSLQSRTLYLLKQTD